jgi:glyoxylase-like metal-dependent hydrolase (beta-lactamase superfamily II)/rhodanese-related sulfurtransferase
MAEASTISVRELQDLLEGRTPLTVLDIRNARDRAEWAIPGSLHVDANQALWAHDPQALADVPLPNDQPVVAVCARGRTSLLAVEALRRRGIEARSLEGGMKAWSLAWNVGEVALPGVSATVLQVRRTGKGCLSYVIGSAGQAAVIDASLDPEVFLEITAAREWRITAVIETHVHADHLWRGKALAERAGAALRIPEQQRVTFPFTPVRDGDVIAIGDAKLSAMRTPGHTFESTCFRLEQANGKGGALFTGDTLFLTSVGRPDLKASDESETRTRAEALHASLQRVLALDPATLILPGHTSQPIAFDGKALAAPLAQVRRDAAMLALDAHTFVETILPRIPANPPNHQQIVTLNEAGEWPAGDPTDLEAGANRCAVM